MISRMYAAILAVLMRQPSSSIARSTLVRRLFTRSMRSAIFGMLIFLSPLHSVIWFGMARASMKLKCASRSSCMSLAASHIPSYRRSISMSIDTHKALVRRWFGEIVNGQTDPATLLAALDATFAPEFVDHDGPDPQHGRAALQRALPLLL